jgi:hypothetical protein
MSPVSMRYMIDDVPVGVKFYTNNLGFTLDLGASPPFATVTRDSVRLLLSGKASCARRAMPDGRESFPGGWNRISYNPALHQLATLHPIDGDALEREHAWPV